MFTVSFDVVIKRICAVCARRQQGSERQVIGLLGNSGNSVGPHLHFHIGDEYSLNGGDLNGNEGIPFVFDSFDIIGQTRRHILELPLNNNVIRFSE